MTVNDAVKDIQDIYDLIIKFNNDITDIDMSKIPEFETALKNVFDDNSINKMKINLKPMIIALKAFTIDTILVKNEDQKICQSCGKGFFLHKECDYHNEYANTPVDCSEFIPPSN